MSWPLFIAIFFAVAINDLYFSNLKKKAKKDKLLKYDLPKFEKKEENETK